jgi:hypothetical protein
MSAVQLLILAALFRVDFVRADSLDPNAFKADVSRSSVTTMPAFTVDEAASAKTHTLFMGADIAINLDRDVYKVRDVLGSNWVIDINGREKEISARQAPLNLKITPTLKLTEVSATVVGFKRVAAYSYANDPSVRLTKGLDSTASMNNDLMARAQNAQIIVDTMTNKAMGGAGLFAGTWDQFSANALMATAQYAGAATHPGKGLTPSSAVPTATTSAPGTDVNVALAQTASVAITRQATNGNEPGSIASRGLDALDIEFDIRSSKPLHNPYIVTMTRFRTASSRPGMVQNMVYAESLHPIDEHLSHVHFVEEGFPFDYELVDFQVHIYNRGEEVATNIAADRVELTRDEAFEYVKMEYVGAHPKDTLPAVPVMGKLPADLPAKLGQGKYAGVYYVRVSKEGLAFTAYSDPACTKEIDDPYLTSVIKRIRFKPALNNGKTVDSIAPLRLGQLSI